MTKLAIAKPASAKEIERWALVHHGFELSEDTIRKAHRGEVDPHKCNVQLLVALMAFYECGPADLGVAAERALLPLLSVLSGGPEGGGDLASARSRCTAQLSPGELATVSQIRWHQPELVAVASLGWCQPQLDGVDEEAA